VIWADGAETRSRGEQFEPERGSGDEKKAPSEGGGYNHPGGWGQKGGTGKLHVFWRDRHLTLAQAHRKSRGKKSYVSLWGKWGGLGGVGVSLGV